MPSWHSWPTRWTTTVRWSASGSATDGRRWRVARQVSLLWHHSGRSSAREVDDLRSRPSGRSLRRRCWRTKSLMSDRLADRSNPVKTGSDRQKPVAARHFSVRVCFFLVSSPFALCIERMMACILFFKEFEMNFLRILLSIYLISIFMVCAWLPVCFVKIKRTCLADDCVACAWSNCM